MAAWSAAGQEDPFEALDKLLEGNFEGIDRSLEEQYQLIDDALESGNARLAEEIISFWGQDETKLPSKKQWVDYSKDFQTRRVIDFETGMVKVERLVSQDDSIFQVIDDINEAAKSIASDSMADLSEKDLALSYARESLAEDGIELSEAPAGSTAPILEGVSYSVDSARLKSLIIATIENSGLAKSSTAEIRKPEEKKQAGQSVSVEKKITVSVKKIGNGKKVVRVEVPLRKNYDSVLANKYAVEISREAEIQNLPPSLLFAVMETESNFNPRARSAVPAFGLMQLVPRSGAMDAYEYVHGEKLLLDPEYLYQADNNVELGAAYLSVLQNRYLKRISNPLTREYCAIAAYNTGAGNVARSFVGTNNLRAAVEIINGMTPSAVYDHLEQKLPYEETRRYIKKVTKAKIKYKDYDDI
ncbi:MAG: hypothetical protein CMQ20_14940 [Gammaproteobacteria bacterium]|jgi:membrane-bound lytic murein transglycosylase C|nr:hypothetical protein [Gammaproteobacteria bacterium]|tara:strand:- start:8618 stop:9862 length:1245 start_codon:yes stop_codon:yes gene_type:complete